MSISSPPNKRVKFNFKNNTSSDVEKLPAGTGMECGSCDHVVLLKNELMFYEKKETEVHLIIKPEIEAIIEGNKKVLIETEKKKIRLKCPNCQSSIGVRLPFAPNGTSFSGFACGKVKLNKVSYAKIKWPSVYKDLDIEIRDSTNFFNSVAEDKKEVPNYCKKIDTPVKFASNELKDYEWHSVSIRKNPFDYQIQAFVEGLQKNLIVVLNTGAGKTLVASMLLARMKTLNPERMGLMLVERVPLVFQQGNAISADTGLKVLSLCGENKTALMLQELNNDSYDILVITAGSLNELFHANKLDVSLFSCVIFDECHHLTGNHIYLDLMRAFASQRKEMQPRIIGLSASPFSATSFQEGEKKLMKLHMVFPDVKVFSPVMPPAPQETIKQMISTSAEQDKFISYLVAKVNGILRNLKDTIDIDVALLKEDLINFSNFLGQIRTYLDMDIYKDHKEDFEVVLILMEAIEKCLYLGVPYAINLIIEEPQFQDIVRKNENVKSDSMRLNLLMKYINETSKESKILVFVKTRSLARSMTMWAKENYPHLNPQKVVGHGGYDGMVWYGEQDEAIRKFSTEEDTNLLISTTVLEEGIDVTACDLVIGFSGSSSLIQFIQMRGRARKQNSKFILFQTEREEKQQNDAIHLEKLMKSILKSNEQSNNYFTERSRHIITAINEKVPIDINRSYENQDFNVKTDSSDISITFYIENSKQCENIKDNLMRDLENVDCFKLKRLLEVNSIEATLNVQDFIDKSTTRVFLAYVVALNSSLTIDDVYRTFCASYKFRIRYQGNTYNVWTKQNGVPEGNLKEVVSITCLSYATGYFENSHKMLTARDFPSKCEIKFTPSNDIEIVEHLEEDTVRNITTIKFNTVKNFAFLMYRHQQAMLVITLDSVPIFNQASKTPRDTYVCKRLFDTKNQVCFSKSPTLILNFGLKDELSLKRILASKCIFPIPVFNASIDVEKDTEIFSSQPANELNEQVIWELKCLQDGRKVCHSQNLVQNINDYLRHNHSDYIYDVITAGLARLGNGHYPYFSDSYLELKSFYESMRDICNEKYYDLLKPKVPENHILIKRVAITPTRIISLTEHPTPYSRLLRFIDSENITVVIVAFRDEDMSKVQDSSLVPRYKDVLINGFTINNETYHFLLSSGSQLREHKGYFVKTEDLQFVQAIRNKFVPDPEKFTSVAKYISRLGMYGTADFHAFKIPQSEIQWSDDIKAENGDLTTDGSGLISYEKATEIKRMFKLKEIPSAFQIRYSGCKGVLVCVENDNPQLNGKAILMRDSMKKYDNGDEDFCVVGYSKADALVLNREIINLLTSIPDFELERKLLKYLNERISSNVRTFEDERRAKSALSRHMSFDFVDQVWKGGLKFLQDSYWLTLLQGVYRLETKVLKSKMNMPVEKGILLIGVPDPYGVLKEDEIFVQVKKDDSEKGDIIESRALIYRNPCLHPGDYRVVTCVRHEKLMHLRNVVVLPSVSCKRSLAALCSGGDLDGDKFAVIWDNELVPTESFTPCDYGNINSADVLNSADVTTPKEIADFISNFMTNDSLGRIANLHLALCDVLEKGARDPLAIKLSEAQSSAVDYPKTGIKPVIPKEALALVKKYPDFMEKKFEATYPSSKPLGTLYRHCQSILYDFNVKDAFDEAIFPDNVFLEVKGFERYLEEAKKIYKLFKYQVEMLLCKYNLIDETDVVLADATYGWDEQYEGSKSKISESVKLTYEGISMALREVFFDNTNDEKDQMMKAYAWYYLVYNNNSGLHEKQPLKSFAWLLYDILCKIKQYKRVSSSNVNIQIGRSVEKLFFEKIKPVSKSISEKFILVETVRETIKRFLKKDQKIEKKCFLVVPYGSTSIYLCEPESDIDICVVALPTVFETKIIPNDISSKFGQLPKSAQYRHFLRMVISRAIEPIATDKKELLHENQKIPLLKFVTPSKDNPISCDISMNENGLLKTYYIQYLYRKSPCNYIVFFALIQWARASDLIKSNISGGLIKAIDTADFYAIIIHILEFPEAPDQKTSKKIDVVPLKTLKRDLKDLQVNDLHKIGAMVLKFFQKLSFCTGNLHIDWPVAGVEAVDIPSDMVLNISAYAKRAYHCLLYGRNIKRLLDYFAMSDNSYSEFIMNLGRSLSYTIGKSKTFFEGKLSLLSNSEVHLSFNTRDELILCANATKSGKIAIKNEIIKYKNTSKAIHEGQLPQNSSRYFMEGASSVLTPQSTMGESRVKFVESNSSFEAIHATSERSVIFIASLTKEAMLEYDEKRKNKFFTHVLKQLKMFPLDQEEMRNSLEITTRYGCQYFINVGSTLPASSIHFDELDFAMQRGRKTRSKWFRQDFKERQNYKMVTMKTEKTTELESESLKEVIKSEMKRKKKRKSGVASSFTPGLIENNKDDPNVRKSLKEIYFKCLEKFGFKRGEVLDRIRCAYKVSVVASTSFELQLLLTDSFSLQAVEERPLNWVHATLLSGEEQKFYHSIQSTIDTRIIIATVKNVSPDSDLYKRVLLKDGEVVLPVKLVDGQPAPNAASDFAKKVINVRQLDEVYAFTNGKVDASVILGKNLALKDLKTAREYCEISLYTDGRKWAKALNNNLDVEKLKELSNELYDVSKKFKEMLKEEIETAGSIEMETA